MRKNRKKEVYNSTMITFLPFNSDLFPTWQQCLQKSRHSYPFYAYPWFKIYFDTAGKEKKPFVLYDAELQTLAIFEREESILLSPAGEITDYQDLIGPEENKPTMWKRIVEYAAKETIKKIVFSNIPEDSTTLSYFNENKLTQNITITLEKEDTTPKLIFPSTYDEYLQSLSRKDRHELKRKLRKFEREHPDFELKVCTSPAEHIDMLLNLMKKDERKAAFFTEGNEAFFRTLPQEFPDTFFLETLFVNKTPATEILAFTTKTEFLLYNSGFDQAQFPGAGFYLKAMSVKQALEKGYKEYNFLQGNERYKHELGGKDFFVYTITLSIK